MKINPSTFETYKTDIALTKEKIAKLEAMRVEYRELIKKLTKNQMKDILDRFTINFTYESNAIEGNRLSLRDTHLILQENIVPQDATTYEYNEVLNSRKCMGFIKDYDGEFNHSFLLKVHKILTENTSVRICGKFRNHNVMITGSSHRPPDFKHLKDLMKEFFIWYNNSKRRLHPLELACVVHTKFTRIHPFSDGNGRTARIISNFILYKHDYPMFFVDVKDRRRYYNSLDESDKGNERAFVKFVFDNIIEQIKPKTPK